MKIGRLKKVDVRNIWQSEASSFTPWLAKDENIEVLGETIGLELEVVGEEKSVGPFRADILCKSTIDDTYVLIENQLEKTDHTHLGQLLTYAAGLEAVNIVWIAPKFTDEHRATLDWLNRFTDEKLRFFGIELEAYQIGDSVPAPLFQIVSKPNDWTKAAHRIQNQSSLTETKILYLEYWTEFKKYIEASNSKLKCQKPSPHHWTTFAIGRTYFKLCVSASVRNHSIRIELIIDGIESKKRFDQLQEQFEEKAYAAIDERLIWDKMEDKIQSWIHLTEKANISNKSDWPNQFEWVKINLEKFDSFFRKKIKTLN